MKKKANEISVVDYAGKSSLTIVEIYRLIDSGELKSVRRDKKDYILLDS